MRAMTAAALPLARSGYEVILDFSIPPQFLETARKILKEVPLNYIVLLPSLAVCESRASQRSEGKISNYADYRDFYSLFADSLPYIVSDDDADAHTIAKRIYESLGTGKFRVA